MEQQISGKLKIVKMLNLSRNGNPNYLIDVAGVEIVTQNDSFYNLEIEILQGKNVKVSAKLKHNKLKLVKIH